MSLEFLNCSVRITFQPSPPRYWAMTGVFLGVFAETELSNELAKDMTASRAGGSPYVIQDTWLSDHYPKCRMCGKEMVFVLQLFSDYDPDAYRREEAYKVANLVYKLPLIGFLHVFVCPSMACSRQNEGWRCFRTMRPATNTSSSSVGCPVTAEKFNFMSSTEPAASAEGGAADAFDLSDLANALDGVELSEGSLFGAKDDPTKKGEKDSSSSSASTDVRQCNVPGVRVQPKEETSITLTPGYQLYVVPEPAKWEPSLSKEEELYKAYLDLGNPDPSLAATVKESHGAVIADDDFAGIEEDEMNTTFLKFQERTSRFPGQVLRYDYNGSPLWAGKFAEESKKAIARQVPPCRACGAPRAFEFQLLPSLFYLSGWFEGHESEMEWGIAAMYTCSEDCRGSGGLSFNPTASVYEEFVLLEPAEDGSKKDRIALRELESVRYVAREKSMKAEEAQKILQIEESRLGRLRRSKGAKPREVKEQQDRVQAAWRLLTEREGIRDLVLLEAHRLEASALGSLQRLRSSKEEDDATATKLLQREVRRARRDVQRERARLDEVDTQRAVEEDRERTSAARAREAQLAARRRLFATQQILKARNAEDDEMRQRMKEQAEARVLRLRDSLLLSEERVKRGSSRRNAEELERLTKFEAEKKELLEQGLNPYEVFRSRQLEETKAKNQRRAVELRQMRDEALKRKMQYEAKMKAAEVADRAQRKALEAEFQRNVSGVADKERYGKFIAKHSIGGVSVLDPTGTAIRIDGSKVTVCRDMSFGLGRASEEVIEKAKADVAALERSVRSVLGRTKSDRGNRGFGDGEQTEMNQPQESGTRLFSTLLVAEQRGGKLEKSSLCAAAAASQLDKDFSVMLAGGPREAAEEAARLPGVKKVYHCNPGDAALEHPAADTFANAVVKLSKEMGASYIVAGNSSVIRDSIPRAAAMLDAQPITDVVKVVSNDTFKRPMYAGNVIATVKSSDPVKVLVFRPTAFEPSEVPQGGAAAEIVKEEIDTKSSSIEFISEADKSTEKPMLQTAPIVVAGGRALKNKETFDSVLDPLADKLGAALGATRAAVDAGYCSNDLQIGQTGKVVAPQLYIAIGISGAIQHTAGIKDSKCIVAINKDAEAPIFQVADYGLVGDLYKIVPELTAKI
ncbi:Electron transfer flavoprotein alpha-subunit [Perkinsus olseni]|uniref:Electron transfer flavoprotein alpha-subunit n=1 Tax=Perkinsus olseni TaxID=32597 RepID=A0A7J6LY17_PEROL|nr:Electron transfer flavoprotein alpha-subunit [Perkinsus olseni]